ncbi:Oidioi.mRNA.OKI2018_I69.chr2.g5261.t1.cds [Oikopleura dioica]|uniref:Oidioi.mRNA.OKI2018_I69.chr2.g5261.t1.cds n=1 Tax=Oikopleura dioica TaxID=34765 RepID=A0ABN7T365_OIKDI|nr:Oidioi.mRNA.OKI2018_I69.chr2.g5261.t1.cds [Oikopleura dioica]
MKISAGLLASAMAGWSDNFNRLPEATQFQQFEACKEAVHEVLSSHDIPNGGFNCDHLSSPGVHHTISCFASCDAGNYEAQWRTSRFFVQCRSSPVVKKKFRGSQECTVAPEDECEDFYNEALFPMGNFVLKGHAKRGRHKLARFELRCQDSDDFAKATCMSNQGTLKSKEDLDTFCVPEQPYCEPPEVIEGDWVPIKIRKNGDKVFELHCPNTNFDMRGKVVCSKSTGNFWNRHHSLDEFLTFCVPNGGSGEGSGESSGEGSG